MSLTLWNSSENLDEFKNLENGKMSFPYKVERNEGDKVLGEESCKHIVVHFV